MKKLLIWVAIVATAFVQNAQAQQDNTAAQASALLPAYYKIKDALVASNAGLTASTAAELLKVAHSADAKILSDSSRSGLLAPAIKIASSKDLKVQREQFAVLSDRMILLAKSSKLSEEPIYQQYCPMKKSNWLSSEKTIKNPYYGSSMLTCGKITDTFK